MVHLPWSLGYSPQFLNKLQAFRAKVDKLPTEAPLTDKK